MEEWKDFSGCSRQQAASLAGWNSLSRDELSNLRQTLIAGIGESKNWLPRYRGCQWKVGDGYEGMISSVNTRSLLIRRYYFGTSSRSSLRRKKRMKERINAPGTYASSSHGWIREDAFLKLSGFASKRKEKKCATKKWDYSAPIPGEDFGDSRNRTILVEKVANFQHLIILLNRKIYWRGAYWKYEIYNNIVQNYFSL